MAAEEEFEKVLKGVVAHQLSSQNNRFRMRGQTPQSTPSAVYPLFRTYFFLTTHALYAASPFNTFLKIFLRMTAVSCGPIKPLVKPAPFPFDHCHRFRPWPVALWYLPTHWDKHIFKPLDLFKLAPTPRDENMGLKTFKTVLDFNHRTISVKAHSGSLRGYYPHFTSLVEPLTIYFDIFSAHAAIVTGGFYNIRHLSTLNRSYHWGAVLQYHKFFYASLPQYVKTIQAGHDLTDNWWTSMNCH